MPINAEELRRQARVERVTVSHCVHSGKKNQDFVSLTLKAPTEEGWTLEEAHIIHKIASRDVMEMAYMDALANGHWGKSSVKQEMGQKKRNFDALIAGLEKKYNKSDEADSKAA